MVFKMGSNVRGLNGSYSEIAERFRKIRKEAEHTHQATLRGKGYKTETENRLRLKAERLLDEVRPGEMMLPEMPELLGAERLIGATNDILSTEFLEMGMLAKHPVGRVEGGAGSGSGFLVGEGLLITNNHVLPKATIADDSTVVFGDEDRIWAPNPSQREYALDAGRFFFTDAKVDTTIVAVANSQFEPNIDLYGHLPLIERQGKAIRGDALSMIHHPKGGRRSLTMFNGILLFIENGGEMDPFFWHSCDTLPGSSGAPVFNAQWEVVGLHRRGVPNTDKNNNFLDRNGKRIADDEIDEDMSRVDWIANEAVRTSRIVAALEKADLPAEMASIRERLIKLWNRKRAARDGLMKAKVGIDAVG